MLKLLIVIIVIIIIIIIIINNINKEFRLGCLGFSVATTNYIKSYGNQSAVPTMSQV